MTQINVNTGLTASNVRASGDSWSELMKAMWEGDLPQGEDLNRDLVGAARIYIAPDGKTWGAPNGRNIWDAFRSEIQDWEKARVLEKVKDRNWDNVGNIKDTSRRFGEAKEWDHFRIELTKADAVALTQHLEDQGLSGEELRKARIEALQEVMRTVVDTLRDSPLGGTRAVVAYPVHLDTGNPHFDLVVSRLSIDAENRKVYGMVDYTNRSVLADEFKKVADAVRDRHGLVLSDLRIQDRSIFENRAPESVREAREKVAEAVQAAGGAEPTPDQKGGSDSFAKPTLVSPEVARIRDFKTSRLRDAERLQVQLTAATTDIAVADHAEAAIIRAEEAERAKAVAEQELAAAVERATAAEATADQAAEQIATLAGKLEQAEQELAAARSEVADLTQDRDGLRAELEEAEKANEQLATDLEGTKQAAAAELEATKAAAAEELGKVVAERDSFKAELEEARAGLATFKTELAALRADAEATRSVLTATKDQLANTQHELKAERDSIPQRIEKAVSEAIAALRDQHDKAMGEARDRYNKMLADVKDSYEASKASYQGVIDDLRGQLAAAINAVADRVAPAPKAEATPAAATPAAPVAAPVVPEQKAEAARPARPARQNWRAFKGEPNQMPEPMLNQFLKEFKQAQDDGLIEKTEGDKATVQARRDYFMGQRAAYATEQAEKAAKAAERQQAREQAKEDKHDLKPKGPKPKGMKGGDED